MFEFVLMVGSALLSALGITAVIAAMLEAGLITLSSTDFGLICYFSWLPGLGISMFVITMLHSIESSKTSS
jgi:hypothetical protein